MERNPDLDLRFGALLRLKCWAVFDVNGFSILANYTHRKHLRLQRWSGTEKGTARGPPAWVPGIFLQ